MMQSRPSLSLEIIVRAVISFKEPRLIRRFPMDNMMT